MGMYYSWPDEEAAYAYAGQYMFGPDVLVAPITQKAAEDGKAAKDVWLPPLDRSNALGASWLHWNGTVAHSGSVLQARWGLEELPLFVRPGTIIPMRTTVSTHAVFVDPLVWAVWAGTPGSSTSAMLFEDAGDGLEYTWAQEE